MFILSIINLLLLRLGPSFYYASTRDVFVLVCASTKRQQLILYSSSVDLKDEISAQQLLYLDSLEIGLEEQYMYYASGSMFMFTLTP